MPSRRTSAGETSREGGFSGVVSYFRELNVLPTVPMPVVIVVMPVVPVMVVIICVTRIMYCGFRVSRRPGNYTERDERE
jgi:hypothetical protein